MGLSVATLGLMDRIVAYFAAGILPEPEELSCAFWGACHGTQRAAAEYLLGQGADANWLPWWEGLTPLDAARREGAAELVEWLHGRGARSAGELS